MRVKLFLQNGKVFEIGENDWIGVRVSRDIASGSSWATACNTKKTLFKVLNANKWLFIEKKSGSYAIRGGEVVEAKVIEDGKEAMLWRRADEAEELSKTE